MKIRVANTAAILNFCNESGKKRRLSGNFQETVVHGRTHGEQVTVEDPG